MKENLKWITALYEKNWGIMFFAHFFCKNFEQRLLAASCLWTPSSVHSYAWNNSAPIGWIFVKFDTREYFQKICRQI